MIKISLKKKSTTVTIPTKKSSSKQNDKAKPVKITTRPVKAKTIKAPKVEAHKIQKAQQSQQPQLGDIKLATTGDASGVHIHTLHQGNPVHKFSLFRSDYALWNKMHPQQKYDYVKLRIDHAVFDHDMNIIHVIIITTCKILNILFAQATKAK